jgi:hypothetical protein
MDYRAHHRHVMNVIADEVKKDLDGRANPIMEVSTYLCQGKCSTLPLAKPVVDIQHVTVYYLFNN